MFYKLKINMFSKYSIYNYYVSYFGNLSNTSNLALAIIVCFFQNVHTSQNIDTLKYPKCLNSCMLVLY